MIDPALIDLTFHLSQPPPAVIEHFRPSPARDSARATERLVREAERWNAAWVREAERQVEGLRLRLEGGPADPEELRVLDRLIALLDAQLDEQAALFRREETRGRRFLKRLKAASPAQWETAQAEWSRLVAAYAKSSLARFELTLALKAIRAQHDPAARTGPVFDDAASLGAYLRAAVA
jgi:hypothetical protein